MSRRILGFTAACVTLLIASEARSADLPLPKDGWASWEVEAVEDAPATCCWGSWSEGAATRKTCNLDNESRGYGSRDGTRTDTIRVYAKLANGNVQKLRTLDSDFHIRPRSPRRRCQAPERTPLTRTRPPASCGPAGSCKFGVIGRIRQ